MNMNWKLTVFLLFSSSLINGLDASTDKLFVCYYTATGYFPATQVPADLCSHIIYSYGNVSPDGIKPKKSEDVQNYKTILNLKQTNPNLKVLLSLQFGFESVVRAGSDIMTDFTKKAVVFLQNYGFDGVDLDWEFPKASDKENYQQFIKIFKSEFAKVNMLLSMALPNSPFYFKGFDANTLTSYVDFMTAMTYDLHMFKRNIDNSTGYNSPLFTPKGDGKYYSTSAVINFYLTQNITASKLLVGIPTFGRSWTLADPSKHDLHSPAVDKGSPGPYRHFRGVYLYPDACVAKTQGATTVADDVNVAAYLYFNTTWVSYDNIWTIQQKVAWMKSQNLGGVGVWALHLDDNSQVCGQGFLPLLSTIKSNL
ncbi:chitinase protein 4 [Biomphalaria glabrata]|nr:chitinase protein 4 [Biomphalaria glabrata]